MYNLKKKDEGIALITLIVTIIVLLILVGISIVMIVRDNGILKNELNAKDKTEISVVEELANLEYTSIYMDDTTKGQEEIMNEVVSKLSEEGYYIKSVSSNVITLDDINLKIDEKVIENLNFYINETKKIVISMNNSSSNIINYVLINGKYHKIEIQKNGNSDKLVVNKEETNLLPSDNTQEPITLTPSENLSGLITINGDEINTIPQKISITDGMELIISAKNIISTNGYLTLSCGSSRNYNINIEKLNIKLLDETVATKSNVSAAENTEILLGSEHFFVLENNDGQIKAISKYNLSKSINNIQMTDSLEDYRSNMNTSYWKGDDNTFKEGYGKKEGESYAYVYDKNHSSYNVIENYVKYLNSQIKNKIIGYAPSYELMYKQNISIRASGYDYWLGSAWGAYNDSRVRMIFKNGNFDQYYKNNNLCGTRPVIQFELE